MRSKLVVEVLHRMRFGFLLIITHLLFLSHHDRQHHSFAFSFGFQLQRTNHPRRTNTQSVATVLDATTQSRDTLTNNCREANVAEDRRKSILRLNQRKLPKQILQCRTNVTKALGVLSSAYPYLNVDLERQFGSTSMNSDWSYESLVNILQKRNEDYDGCTSKDDGIRIIDEKSIIATMEVLRKARNVPVALQLLKLTVDAVQYNQANRKRIYQHQTREQDSDSSIQSVLSGHLYLEGKEEEEEEEDGNKNELRRVYKSMISLLGNTHQQEGSSPNNYSPRLIMYILHHHMPDNSKIQPGAEIYHAAINGLGRSGQRDLLLNILADMEEAEEGSYLSTKQHAAPLVDKMAFQTAISSLARNGYCHDATQLLYRMQDKGWVPDMNVYNELLIGIAKEAGRDDTTTTDNGQMTMSWHQVALRLLNEMETNNIQPTEQTYNSIISACGKEGAWDDVSRVAKRAELSTENVGQLYTSRELPTDSDDTDTQQQSSSIYFQNLLPYRKVGKGKDSWWEVGRYSSVIVGIQPHRNPSSNGLSMVFYDETSGDKLGRILLRNISSLRSSKNKEDQPEPIYYSSLVGMEVNKQRRDEGLSKVFVAIWLRLCLDTHTYPRAAVMNKPLIAHVLMKFGFLPQNGGSRVELIRLDSSTENILSGDKDGYSPKFALYSPSAKSLQGLFSERVLRTQSIVVLDHPPPLTSRKSGTVIYLKTKFEHPIAIVEDAVEYNPPPSLNLDDEWLRVKDRSDVTNESNSQRRIVAEQIHSILNKSDQGASSELQFFTNSTSLKGAFFPSNVQL